MKALKTRWLGARLFLLHISYLKTHKVMLVRNSRLGSELLIPEIIKAKRSSRLEQGSRVSSLLSETESSVKVG